MDAGLLLTCSLVLAYPPRSSQSISQSPFVQSLGLAGLPLPFLQSLFPAQRQSTPFNVPSAYRLPRVIAMGTQAGDACSITSNEELLRWCHSWEEIGADAVLALSHNDPEGESKVAEE